MSTIKVDTIATRTGSGNITASNTIAGTSATLSGTLGVTGATTLSNNVAVNGGTGGQVATNFSSASTMGMKINDTNSGNLGGMLGFYSGSGAGTLRANIQNANNAGVHFSVGTGGSVVFTQTGYTAANALDDYEEGTFTPAMNTASSHVVQQGFYTKVGRIVHCQITLEWVQSGTTAGRITGLPFTVFGQNYTSVMSREYYSTGNTWNAHIQIGSTQTTGFTYGSNSSAVNNGQTLGLGLTFVYRVS